MSPLIKVLLLIALLLVSACGALWSISSHGLPSFLLGFSRTAPESALFVGDVMLARSVEKRIAELGPDTFFTGVLPLHESSRYVIANFEATVPRVHEPTPDLTFRFSVKEELLSLLTDARVTHVSLANNHAFDYGEEAYQNAWQALESRGLEPFGHPTLVTASSSRVITLDGVSIGITGVHSVWREPSLESLRAELARMSSTTEIQIVFVHWGTEYAPVHSDTQEAFARILIDAGADIIIGHHPHVLQDIDVIDGVPVFYSLGNYVFDQWWDSEVRTGLGVRFSVSESEFHFDLIPISIPRAQPLVMEGKEAGAVLRSLALRSDERLRSGIVAGSVSLPR